MRTLQDLINHVLPLLKPVFEKYQDKMAQPNVFIAMETEFNSVIMSAKLRGELEGGFEKLAGFMFPVVQLRVKINVVDGKPNIEFCQTTDASSFKRDFSKFPKVVACAPAQLELILVDAVTAAMTDWRLQLPDDTAEYQDMNGLFAVRLRLRPDGTLKAAYPQWDDYTKFNERNPSFLEFKSIDGVAS